MKDGIKIGFCIGIIVAMLVCIFTGKTNSEWHKEAIQHQAAHYNVTNGVFEWNK